MEGIRLLSETIIQELISCKKRAVKADRKRMVLLNRSYRNDVSLISLDNKYTFKMFMRYSNDFNEDFSVGLIWTNSDKFFDVSKPIILIRYQGPHDSGQPLNGDIHNDYHIHEITSEDINEGRFLKPSSKETTNKYASFGEAVQSFEADCSVIGLRECIDISQIYKNIPGQVKLPI